METVSAPAIDADKWALDGLRCAGASSIRPILAAVDGSS